MHVFFDLCADAHTHSSEASFQYIVDCGTLHLPRLLSLTQFPSRVVCLDTRSFVMGMTRCLKAVKNP